MNKEIKIDPKNIKEFLKRDALYIIALLIALLCCLFVLLDLGNYQQACNNHYQEQVKKVCGVTPEPFNTSFKESNIIRGFINGNKNTD